MGLRPASLTFCSALTRPLPSLGARLPQTFPLRRETPRRHRRSAAGWEGQALAELRPREPAPPRVRRPLPHGQLLPVVRAGLASVSRQHRRPSSPPRLSLTPIISPGPLPHTERDDHPTDGETSPLRGRRGRRDAAGERRAGRSGPAGSPGVSKASPDGGEGRAAGSARSAGTGMTSPER